MLARYSVAAVFLSAAMLSVGPPARAQQSVGPQTSQEADQDYPKAWVCKDIQQTQVDDKEGVCKADNTPLVPIRLGTIYKCLRGPANYSIDQTGRCASPQPKGAVTASVFWTCKSQPDVHLLDPGKCADGSPREIGFEERPHGDHNPRHGGLAIFMSPDLYYHVEGTYSSNGTFRAYFYNEFTKPLKVSGITGRVALANSNNEAVGQPITLTVAPIADGNALEAKIPNPPTPTKDKNVFFKLYIKLPKASQDWITDHQFLGFSNDPNPPAAAPATTGSARGNQTGTTARNGQTSGASRGAQPAPGAAPRPAATPNNAARGSAPATPPNTAAKPAAPAARPNAAASPAPAPAAPPTPAAPPAPAASPSSATASAASPTPGQEAGSSSSSSQSSVGVMGGAEVSAGPGGPQVLLPDTTPELLAFFKENAANVRQLLDQGQLGGMWYPALNAKDAALSLDEKHHEGLNDAQRAQLASAAKQLTVVAWQIDAAGDLGNRTQLDQLTKQFDDTAAEILALYGK
jgi:hypothetical protein